MGTRTFLAYIVDDPGGFDGLTARRSDGILGDMVTQTAHGPLTSAPLRVRPPYDQRDVAGAQRQNETVQQWWDRRRVDGMDALLTPLAGIDVSDYERDILKWLTGREDFTIAVVAALLHRARAAQPLSTEAR
jgi:hypothetical protein